MAKVSFNVDAYTARLIGRENVSKLEGAVIELIKNTYDADASICLLYYDEIADILYIADNGTGMTKDVIMKHWMTIGRSSKKRTYVTGTGRIQTGAKGIGRFALNRIAEKCTMLTGTKEKKENIIWTVDWSDFTGNRNITEITADIESTNISFEQFMSHCNNHEVVELINQKWENNGTIFKLSNLHEVWDDILIHNIRENLSSLIPYELEDLYKIYCFDNKTKIQDAQIFSNIDAFSYDYKIEYEVGKDKGQQDVCYKIWREEFDFGSEEDEVLSGAGLLEEKRLFHGKPIEKKCVFRDIIIDEAHHSSANSYQKIMNYFEPDFWLGMTATPDKRDDNIDGRNIYEIFDHNIVYEIRLQQAMEEDLLCPFHYFGITDLQMISDTGNSKEERLENFRYLTSDERVNYVMNQADYYGYSGDCVKGLIFCSRIDEAKELSAKFNHRGWRTMVLSGEDSEEVRADAIERLAGDECENALDYILSVDIFSEGVDVVEINQVIMLRPTQSPIVFVQQLGRGLRKADGKEYVVILDFIGNYKNNFMIPIALSGDRSYNKDTIRRYVMEGSRVIPGSSTIHFDEISKSKIYAAIDRLSTPRKMLIEKYTLLKDKLGKIPSMIDFYDYGEIDPLLFINYAGTYHAFLQIADKEYQTQLTENENVTLEFLSQNVASGKRIYELLMLKQFLNYGELRKGEIEALLREEYHKDFSEESYESSLNVLSGGFMNTQSEKKKYADINIVEYSPSRTYSRLYSYNQGVKQLPLYQQLSDLIQLGLCRYRDIYSENQDEMGLALYQKYSRKDVCRILNWERDDSSTVYGYKIKNGSCPIFVTYEKKDNIASSTKYEDVFLANNLFSWMTRSRVSLDSDETQKLIHYKENGLKILLFIKKSDGEGSDFYYMGLAEPIRWKQTEISNDDGKKLPIMNFQLQLAYSVRDDIYQYFVE